ncbi:unnamed protein product [Urochloa humidicola]
MGFSRCSSSFFHHRPNRRAQKSNRRRRHRHRHRTGAAGPGSTTAAPLVRPWQMWEQGEQGKAAPLAPAMAEVGEGEAGKAGPADLTTRRSGGDHHESATTRRPRRGPRRRKIASVPRLLTWSLSSCDHLGGAGAWVLGQVGSGASDQVHHDKARDRTVETLAGDGLEDYKTPRGGLLHAHSATAFALRKSAGAAEQKVKKFSGKQAIPMGLRYSHQDSVIRTSSEAGENDRIWYAVSSRQDRRRNRKDAFAAVPDLDDLTSFFGVYDGHEGGEVALLCAMQFHNKLNNDSHYRDNLVLAMERTFFRMDMLLRDDKDWKKLIRPRETPGGMQCLPLKACISGYTWPFKRKPETPYMPPQVSGSTACVVAIRGHQIIIANVGRSRCIISRHGQAIDLTTDHEPSNMIERQRIETAEGEVVNVQIPGEAEGFFQQHGVVGTFRIDGILPHTRAIGDFAFKDNPRLPPNEQKVICDPEIHTMDITNDIDFLVIVSDGICPYLSSQNVVDHIRTELYSRRINLRRICEQLCDRCIASGDNTTVILVQFKDAPPPAQAALEENLGDNGGSNNNNNDNAQPPPAPEGGGNNNNNAAQPPPAPEGGEADPLLHVGEITED